eukprot:1148772-Pelagomonas_calceolata.AAC.1
MHRLIVRRCMLGRIQCTDTVVFAPRTFARWCALVPVCGNVHGIAWAMNGPGAPRLCVPIREDVHAQPDPSAPNAKDTPPSDAVQFMDSIK